MAKRVPFTSAAAAIGTLLAAGMPVSADARGLDVSAPLYESPGGVVPTIVTAYDVRAGYGATIAARGTGGSVATCVGDVWINRIRRTASRKCYLRLPHRRGSYRVVGRARITRDGRVAAVRVATGSRPILANGYRSRRSMPLRRVQQIERCFNATDRVWLTFDDGGSPSQLRRILGTLALRNVRGRFFFTGAWAARYPGLMRRIRSEGHLVANHSSTHVPLSKVSAAEVTRQIDNGTRATTAPKLLRPPFAAGALTTRLGSLAAKRGYRLCRWTVDTYDWHGDTAARMAERVRYGDHLTPPVRRGGNILMHGTGRHTSTGLERIIHAVRAERLVLDPLRRTRARPVR